MSAQKEDGWSAEAGTRLPKYGRLDDGETDVELKGHTATVWAVVAYDRDTIITGCADRAIRVFDSRGKLAASFDGKDVVRALCKLPEGHSSGANFASATNDGGYSTVDAQR